CIALMELADRHGSGEPTRIREIVQKDSDIPRTFLVQILLQLKRAGLVVSTRGSSGGYRLTRNPEDVSLAEIVRAMEGDQEQKSGSSRRQGSLATKALDEIWSEIASVEQAMLADVTLAELLERAQGPAENMFYI
ncbi:MAG: Rrf2 family transcriptional regulator, partial [Planctomycetales bacterium]